MEEREYAKMKAKRNEMMIELKHHMLLPNYKLNKARPRPKCLISESNGYKRIWDAWVFACVLYVAIVVPYYLCFNLQDTTAVEVFNWLTDASFTTDIVLTFFTEVYVEKEFVTVTQHREIAAIYLKGWFWIDVISVIPLDHILEKRSKLNGINKSIRIARMLRFYRLLRLFRITKLAR